MARQLWFDAMKGKLMAQRVLVVTCLVVMVACVTAVGLSWRWMNQEQLLRSIAAAQANEANLRMAEALSQAQATNKDMLNKLNEMSEAIRHPRSRDWNPVTFKLTEETPDGPSVAGARLTVHLKGSSIRIDRITDAQGVADFGMLQPGAYKFEIENPTRAVPIAGSEPFKRVARDNSIATQRWRSGFSPATGEFNVALGSEVRKSIVCPKSPPQRVDVVIKCDWPADLEKERLVLYAPFSFRGRTLEPGMRWSLSDQLPQVPGSPAVRSVLCGPGTTRTQILHNRGLLVWTFLINGNAEILAEKAAKLGFRGILETQAMNAVKLGPGDWADILEKDLQEPKDRSQAVNWEVGIYGLNELIVMRPNQSPTVEAGRRRFDVLVACRIPGFGRGMQVDGDPPAEDDLRIVYPRTAGMDYPAAGRGGLYPSIPNLELPAVYWRDVQHRFEARSAEVNEWTIPLPDELINAVREALKVDPTAKAKPPGPAVPADDKK